ncbi:MAG: SPW repeat protein [Bauldia sp.]
MLKRNLTLIDGINLILAIVLVASPWVLSFPAGTVSLNAMIAGSAIGVVAVGALVAFTQWEEWVNLTLGIWVLASPFVLGFSSIANAMWTHVLVGLAVAVLAAVELWMITREPPARTAPG